MDDWYLAYCKARQEGMASQGLKEQGYRVYLPKLRIKRRRPGGAKFIEEPLFPRYLFVGTDSGKHSLGAVQYTRGIQKLVRFGHYPLPVASEIIEAIRAREHPGTGCHRLELPGLRPGDTVSIESGVFAGLNGVFTQRSGHDRVTVLLDILGQQAQASIPIAEIGR